MRPDALPLREILLCQVLQDDPRVLIYVIVLRKGLTFELLDIIKGDVAALLDDPGTQNLLARRFQLPVRVLSGSNGPFLALKTFLATQKGTSYSLVRPSS